jgi:hypothetical protein
MVNISNRTSDVTITGDLIRTKYLSVLLKASHC